MPGKLPASEDDVKQGKAIFHIPDGKSVVVDLGRPLPTKAIFREAALGDDGKSTIPAGTEILVVQAEMVDKAMILIGYRRGSVEGVCTLGEIELVD